MALCGVAGESRQGGGGGGGGRDELVCSAPSVRKTQSKYMWSGGLAFPHCACVTGHLQRVIEMEGR